MIDWFNQPIPEPTKPAKGENPCIALYGKGPEDKKCGECALLVGIAHSRTFYKCRLRKNTNGPASDHKRKYPACGRFEQRTEPIPLYDGR